MQRTLAISNILFFFCFIFITDAVADDSSRYGAATKIGVVPTTRVTTRKGRILRGVRAGAVTAVATAILLNGALHLGPTGPMPGDYLRQPTHSKLVNEIWTAAVDPNRTQQIQLTFKGRPPGKKQLQLLRTGALSYGALSYQKSNRSQEDPLLNGATAAQRRDVEHFFTAARNSSNLGPLLTLAQCAGWDLLLSPLTKIKGGMPVGEAFAYDIKQFGVDFAGVRFGHC